MKDLDHLCVHGREIACPECVDDARAERLGREAQRVESETQRAKNKRRWLEASERADVLLAEIERLNATLDEVCDLRVRLARERDEAVALLKECRTYIDSRANWEDIFAFLDRLDAFLAGGGR